MILWRTFILLHLLNMVQDFTKEQCLSLPTWPSPPSKINS